MDRKSISPPPRCARKAITFALCFLLALTSAFALIFGRSTFAAAEIDPREAAADKWTTSLADAGWADTSTVYWQDVTDAQKATASGGKIALDDGTKTVAPDGYTVTVGTCTVDGVTYDGRAEISSAEGLAYFAHEANLDGNHFANYYVSLACDVDLAGKPWIPIAFDGTDSYFDGLYTAGGADNSRENTEAALENKVIFRGTFDGCGHIIYNLSDKLVTQRGDADSDGIMYDGEKELVYYKEGANAYYFTHPYTDGDFEYAYGLFGTVGNATFKNLTVANVKVTTKRERNDNALADIDDASKKIALKPNATGAIAGTSLGNISVINCTAGLKKDKDAEYINARCVGGLVGRAYASLAYGYPYGGSSSVDSMPIYSGLQQGVVEFINCVNYLTLAQPDSDQYAGGIAGYVNYANKYKFDNCVNYGDVTGMVAGGIVPVLKTRASANTDPTEILEYETIVTDCVNHGNVTATAEVASSSADRATGGIVGYMIGSGDSATSEAACASRYKVIVDGCVNTGNITSYSHNVGGIIGSITAGKGLRNVQDLGMTVYVEPTHLSKDGKPDLTVDYTHITNCFNYGDVVLDYKNLTSRYKISNNAGGLIGEFSSWKLGDYDNDKYAFDKRFVISGVNAGTVTNKVKEADGNSGFSYSAGDAFGRAYIQTTPAKYTSLFTIDYFKNIGESTGAYGYKNLGAAGEGTAVTSYTPREAAQWNGDVSSLADATELLDIDGGVVKGFKDDAVLPDRPYKAILPASVTKIDAYAFAGLSDLVYVGFAEQDSRLTEIGDLAFVRTGLSTVSLPSGIEKIGDGAFALVGGLAVYLDGDAVVIGKEAFENDAYIIVPGKDVYDGIMSADGAMKDLENLTYVVTVDFDYNGEIFGTEKHLYKAEYGVTVNTDGTLRVLDSTNKYIGPNAGTNALSWFADTTGGGAALDYDGFGELLAGDNVAEKIVVYAFYPTSETIIPLTGIVFDGRTDYSKSEINRFFNRAGKQISDADFTVIYYAAGADTAGAGTEVTELGKAGSYKVTADGQTVIFEIAKKEIDDSVLDWQIIADGGKSDMRSQTLYVYNDGERDVPYASKQSAVDLTFRYAAASDSVARYRGSAVTVAIKDTTGFKAEYTGDVTRTDVGIYTAHYALTLTDPDNYIFVGGETEASGDFDWYIIMGNYFVGALGEYRIEDRTFLSGAAQSAPQLMYSDNGGDGMGKITGVLVSDETGTVNIADASELGKYINKTMPAGEYTLTLTAPSVTYIEMYDEAGNILPEGQRTTFEYSSFAETYTFTVGKACIDAEAVKAANDALSGKKISYDLGIQPVTLITQDIKTLIDNALFEKVLTPTAADLENSYWKDHKYANGVTVMFNPLSAMNDEYAETYAFTNAAAGRYDIRFKLVADNYYDSTDAVYYADAAQTDFTFTVVLVGTVEPFAAPTPVVYNGSKQIAGIPEEAFGGVYTVIENNGGTAAGTYAVKLKLNDSEIYKWGGDASKADGDVYTVDFVITAANNNKWLEEPNVVQWVEGKYDGAENLFLGSALYGNDTVTFVVSTDYEGKNVITDFGSLKAGTYWITGIIDGTESYNGLYLPKQFRVLEKEGLPWWAVLLIAVGSLIVVALVIFILWKKGVFRIITDKILIGIRTEIAVESTIASVRAQKMKEEVAKTRAEAIKREQEEERKKLMKENMEAKRALPEEVKIKQVTEKARQTAERAEKLRLRAEAMHARAQRMAERAGIASSEVSEAPADAEAAATDKTETDE